MKALRLAISMLPASLLTPHTASAAVIADSVADFSNIQGGGGWYYGYDAGGGFILMPLYGQSGDSGWWGSNLNLGYPYIGPQSQIPSTADYNGFNAWAVRRWVCDVATDVRVTGTIQRSPYEPSGVGDGILAMVSLNEGYRGGSFLLQQHVGSSDYTLYSYDLVIHVRPGDQLDFITGPYSTMWGDNTVFTATIAADAIPEPADAVVTWPALFSLAALRRRRPQPACHPALPTT